MCKKKKKKPKNNNEKNSKIKQNKFNENGGKNTHKTVNRHMQFVDI